MSAWYKKSLLKVKDIKPHLMSIAKLILNINDVECVYVWGSYSKNKNSPDYIIKNLDLISKTKLFSEDFISIIDDESSPLKIAESKLEDEGFDPRVVLITKELLKIKRHYIDPWIISSDKKLLHWGPVVNDVEEWNETKQLAEKYANFEMNLTKNKLKKASDSIQNRWKVLYDHHINKYLRGIPNGWYELQYEYNQLLNEMEKIV